MRGTIRKISRSRRFVTDLMQASMGVPFVSLTRRLDLQSLVGARDLLARPPGWAAIFVKAFALVARDEPVLRTLYAKWPWPHFYELPRSTAVVAVARVENGEDCVIMERMPRPEGLPLAEIDARLRHAKQAPLGDVPDYRRIVRLMRLPLPLRRFAWWVARNVGRLHGNNFGTFGVTSVAAYGPGQLHALSPGPFIVSYGVVAPDATIDVVIRWDHRIADAALIARAMSRLERVLNSEIAAEFRPNRPAEPRPARAVTK